MKINPLPKPNPFARGVRAYSIDLVLMIGNVVKGERRRRYLPIHSSQAALTSDAVAAMSCRFGPDFALVYTDPEQTFDRELERQCPERGQVNQVMYGLTIDNYGTLVHLGDYYSREDAQEAVKLLQFNTGHYSRCWEINTDHITPDAVDELTALAGQQTLEHLNIDVFLLPYGGLGCKLISTPWTDERLMEIDLITAEQLRQIQLDAGLPECLVNVLHLAAQADIRFLIFDPDAPDLNGLPIPE